MQVLCSQIFFKKVSTLFSFTAVTFSEFAHSAHSAAELPFLAVFGT
jgi:hypothetical protein